MLAVKNGSLLAECMIRDTTNWWSWLIVSVIESLDELFALIGRWYRK